jgi:hypothetical protein
VFWVLGILFFVGSTCVLVVALLVNGNARNRRR